MNKKPGFFQKAEKALAGKGFYMVLLLCLAILGASGYFLFRTVSDISADAASASGSAQVTVTAPVVEEDSTPDTQTEPVDPKLLHHPGGLQGHGGGGGGPAGAGARRPGGGGAGGQPR